MLEIGFGYRHRILWCLFWLITRGGKRGKKKRKNWNEKKESGNKEQNERKTNWKWTQRIRGFGRG